MAYGILKPFPTLRTILKVLIGFISAILASLMSINAKLALALLTYQCQMPGHDLWLLAAGDRPADLRVQLIECVTAGGLHVIVPVPLETRDKKQG